jgi:branched-chain amino acid transport system substrate-binding protein
MNYYSGGSMKFRICITAGFAAAIAAAVTSTAALADITIGVSIGFTGPQASLGVHYKNAFDLLPKTLAGEPV